jgi:hypothetical protein
MARQLPTLTNRTNITRRSQKAPRRRPADWVGSVRTRCRRSPAAKNARKRNHPITPAITTATIASIGGHDAPPQRGHSRYIARELQNQPFFRTTAEPPFRRGPVAEVKLLAGPTQSVCGNPHVGLPGPVPPLIRTPVWPRSCATEVAPLRASRSPRQHSLRAKSFGARARAVKCRCLVMPKCRALHGPDFRRPASGRQRHPHRPNLQFDILHRVT